MALHTKADIACHVLFDWRQRSDRLAGQENHDFVVVGLREHVEKPHTVERVGRQRGNVPGKGLGIAAGIDDGRRPGGFERGAEAFAKSTARRIDDDGVGGVLGGEGGG